MLFKRQLTQFLQTPVPYASPLNYGGEVQNLKHNGLEYSPLSKEFDALVDSRMKHFHVSGLAVAIVHGTETFSKGYGFAEFPDTPVTPETLFYGASTTKAFVAAALSQLIDESKGNTSLQWTTPISELIRDGFVLEDGYTTLHVTLEDAASHRTGLPRHDFSINGDNQTVKEVVRSLRFLPLTKPLRTTFQYCNLMYVTLGHVIETITGSWLGDVLASQIWEPLNMTSTYFSISDALNSGKLAKPHSWLHSAKKFIELDYAEVTPTAGAGGVMSSVLDYSKWVRMMIDRSPPISQSGHEALVHPSIFMEKDDAMGINVMYGYGWQLMNYRGYDVIFHDGADTGFGANVLFIPAKKWGCIMLSNTDFRSNVVEEVLTWHLIDELLQTPRSLRVNRTEIFDKDLEFLRKTENTTFVRELVYPAEKLGNVSASLPLKEYAGTYSHPAYGLWYIQYENETLRNDMDRGTTLGWSAWLDHLTSDRFLVIAYPYDSPEEPLYMEAEFVIDWQGKAEKLGVTLEEEMGAEKIWFDRVK